MDRVAKSSSRPSSGSPKAIGGGRRLAIAPIPPLGSTSRSIDPQKNGRGAGSVTPHAVADSRRCQRHSRESHRCSCWTSPGRGGERTRQMGGLGVPLAARRTRGPRAAPSTNRREEIEFNAGLYGGGTVERLERIDHFLGRRPRADRLPSAPPWSCELSPSLAHRRWHRHATSRLLVPAV